MVYWNRFRREPAITQLDWHFTTKNNSSENLATVTGSVLHFLIQKVSTWSYLDRWVSGPIIIYLFAQLELAFTTYTITIILAYYYYLQIHYTKGTFYSNCFICSISGIISQCLALSISIFSHDTCSLSVAIQYFALEVDTPIFKPSLVLLTESIIFISYY